MHSSGLSDWKIIFSTLSNDEFFQYCESSIGLFSINPPKVIVGNLRAGEGQLSTLSKEVNATTFAIANNNFV